MYACKPSYTIQLQSQDYAEQEVYDACETVLKKRMNQAGIKFQQIQSDADEMTITVSGVRFKDEVSTQSLENLFTQASALTLREVYHTDENGIPDLLEEFTADFTSFAPILKPDAQSNAFLIFTNPAAKEDLLTYLWQEKYIRLLKASLDFVWGQPNPDEAYLRIYALPSAIGAHHLIDNSHITKAEVVVNPYPTISIQLNEEGASRFAALSAELAKNDNRELAIVIDNEVVSAPRVMQEITGGNVLITGQFTRDEAKQLAAMLQSGELPLPLVFDSIQEEKKGN
jgi:preprotein translocase subunit SecD